MLVILSNQGLLCSSLVRFCPVDFRIASVFLATTKYVFIWCLFVFDKLSGARCLTYGMVRVLVWQVGSVELNNAHFRGQYTLEPYE